MKKIGYILGLVILLFACEKDDGGSGSELDNETGRLKSYTIDDGSIAYTHRFKDGNKTVEILKNGVLNTSFEYANEKWQTQKNYFADGESVAVTDQFTYEGDDLVSIEKDIVITGSTKKLTLTHDQDMITVKRTVDGIEDVEYAQFTFNQDDQLVTYEYFTEANSPELRMQFEYDENFNCTKIVQTEWYGYDDFYEEEIETFQIEYDNKINPMHPYYKKYGKELLIKKTFDSRSLRYADMSLVRTFGLNNPVRTIYPEYYPENQQTFLEYDYDADEYPTQARAKFAEFDLIYYTVDFEY